jgi:cellulose biosynthesis protein BcsQ
MATIIALVSQKGGVGKSTLARALAREAAVSGLKVKLADLDTQQGTVAGSMLGLSQSFRLNRSRQLRRH